MPTKHIDFGFRGRPHRPAPAPRPSTPNCSAYGLTDATWRPLAYVGKLGDGVRQKELATALSIEGPTLVRLLDNLERRGLIERREDETDRRARGIYLTRAGRESCRARGQGRHRDPGARAGQGAAGRSRKSARAVFDTIERELDTRLDIAAPAAE